MASFTAHHTTLAGLGLSFDSITVDSSFSSSEESFNSLFSEVNLASPAPSQTELGSDSFIGDGNSSDEDDFTVYSDEEPEMVYYQPSAEGSDVDVSDFLPWPTANLEGRTVVGEDQSSEANSYIDDGYESDAEGRRELTLRHRSRPRRTRVNYLVQRMRPKFEVIYPIGPVPLQTEETIAPTALNADPQATPQMASTSPQSPTPMSDWFENLRAAEPLDAVAMDECNDYDDYEGSLSPSQAMDLEFEGERDCTACTGGPAPQYVSERAPVHVRILPAITEAERAALAALPPDACPDADTLTRPAMLTADGTVVEVPYPSPAPSFNPHTSAPVLRRTDSFESIDLTAGQAEPEPILLVAPIPVTPIIRPWLTAGCDTPSPIVLSSFDHSPDALVAPAPSVRSRIAHWESLSHEHS